MNSGNAGLREALKQSHRKLNDLHLSLVADAGLRNPTPKEQRMYAEFSAIKDIMYLALYEALALPASIPAGEIGRRYAMRTDPLDELSRAVDARAYGGAEIVSLPSIPAPVVDREAIDNAEWFAGLIESAGEPILGNSEWKLLAKTLRTLALLPSAVTDRAVQMEEILREQESRNHLRPAVTADAEAGWQDISTAPENEWVLVANPARGKQPIVAKRKGNFWINHQTAIGFDNKDYPTLWRSLPLPPTDRDGE